LAVHQPDELLNKIAQKIIYYTSYEQACKLLGNSMYGGSSHQAFAWFNMDLANDITGEARNLIHIMESFVPKAIAENKELIDTFIKDHVGDLLFNRAGETSVPLAGDTDSIFFNSLIINKLGNEIESKTLNIEQLYNLGDIDMGDTLKGHESVGFKEGCKVLNYDPKTNQIYYAPIKRVIRHKVTKDKYILKGKNGKMVEVTGDHSCMVFRNGQLIEIRAKDINIETDKILTLK